MGKEIVALVGPSDSGKTTLLQILSGLLGADSGKAAFYGVPLPRVETCRGRGGMSLVFQDPYAALAAHLYVRRMSLLVTIHALAGTWYVADSGLVLSEGLIVEDAAPLDLHAHPRHDLTRSLRRAARFSWHKAWQDADPSPKPP